jgi:hypothetical protein
VRWVSSSQISSRGDDMGYRYGTCVPVFVPYAKFEWYPATRCLFVKGAEYPIAQDCYNRDQARRAAAAWIASQKEEDFIHETDHTSDQEGDA